MLTINTNLSSLIVQSNLLKSTQGLNQAIERMTTGFKINHAKDNAAGYSISTSIGVKLSSYNVAEENAAMGLDLITTASDSFDLISSHLQRMRDLAEQAANGTYGADSLNAIQSEVDARAAEISRITANTEYNGIKLFGGENGGVNFIDEVVQLTEDEALAQGYTVIKTEDELQAMKDNLSGKYILMGDIDLSGYAWEAVGNSSTAFTGEFNGNGYVIKNLTINRPTEEGQGLLGYTDGASIKNVGMENVDVTGGSFVGGLVGWGDSSITNSYATGSVSGTDNVGGLVGWGNSSSSITNSYATGSVSGNSAVGGLVGMAFSSSSITNSYATGSVNGNDKVGGLVGQAFSSSSITRSYATGSVNGNDMVGGLVGRSDSSSSITSSYATGSVSGNSAVGGLVGGSFSSITNSYFNKETTGQSIGVGTGTGTATGVTTTELDQLIADGTLVSFTQAGGPGVSVGITNDRALTIQVGIDSSDNSKISFSTEFAFANLNVDLTSADKARDALTQIDDYIKQINEKQTELGSAYNRLDSVIESIGINIENLTSSQSTIRDADIAEESSEYIKMQILQQASATLLATANQTPALALRLLGGSG